MGRKKIDVVTESNAKGAVCCVTDSTETRMGRITDKWCDPLEGQMYLFRFPGGRKLIRREGQIKFIFV